MDILPKNKICGYHTRVKTSYMDNSFIFKKLLFPLFCKGTY